MLLRTNVKNDSKNEPYKFKFDRGFRVNIGLKSSAELKSEKCVFFVNL